jgi:hypothetical protein
MVVGTEGKVGADRHGCIGRMEIGGDEFDDALEGAAMAEFSECWYSMGHVRVPEVELVVGEPFVESTISDVLGMVSSAEEHPSIGVAIDDGSLIQRNGTEHRKDIIVIEGGQEITENKGEEREIRKQRRYLDVVGRGRIGMVHEGDIKAVMP